MDEFLKKRNQNNVFQAGAITCVYGRTGIGKTHYVTRALPGHVCVDHEIFKSKQGTLDFFQRLRCSATPVIIDNWESLSDLIGVREIQGPLTRGPTVIISAEPVRITPETIMFPMPVMTPDQLVELAPKDHPDVWALAEKCRGDVRTFLRSLRYVSDDPDIFETPREFVEKLISSSTPIDFLKRSVHEHGYVWNMIEENYFDTKNTTIDTCANIAQSLSLADIYDSKIYAEGAWDALMPYFIESAVVRPCVLMNGQLSTKRLRAGSMWTKYQNMCMHAKKIGATRLSHDALLTLRHYVEHEQFTILNDYSHLEASVVDVLNHIVIGRKMKPRIVEKAKTYLRQQKNC